jgi:hypothetical protein
LIEDSYAFASVNKLRCGYQSGQTSADNNHIGIVTH